jgi:hypothetical protein
MKTLLHASIGALCGVLLAAAGVWAVSDESRDKDSEPRDILLADHLHGHWLTIARINHKEPGGEFNPNWTYIRTEAGIIPVVKRYRGGICEITFTSEAVQKGEGIP